MDTSQLKLSRRWELVFMAVLHLVVFALYIQTDRDPVINAEKVFYFLQYVVAGLIVNYVMLPKLLYRKRYYAFGLALVVVIGLLVACEELVMEAIYYPDTRAIRFPGWGMTLANVLPILTILAGGKFAFDALRQRNELEKLRSLVRDSELEALRAQINPHFLFNNLNNLYSYAIEASAKTPEIIMGLSSVLRYMLYESREQFVPLSKEVEHLRNLVKLSELQIEERGEVSFSVSGNTSAFTVAPLLLSVFIENAFKHSQASQADNIQIDIKLDITNEGELHFYCFNNSLTTANTRELNSGIGLTNVRKRLELLYPDLHVLQTTAEAHSYTVNLRLSLNETPLAA